MASSSGCRKRFEPLCCFLPCWLLRGVADRVPPAAVPRCWPKKLALADVGWPCAGEAGPEGAEALDDGARGDGTVDMDMAPNQGSTTATMTMTMTKELSDARRARAQRSVQRAACKVNADLSVEVWRENRRLQSPRGCCSQRRVVAGASMPPGDLRVVT